MKRLKTIILIVGALLLALFSQAQTDCLNPNHPIPPPDCSYRVDMENKQYTKIFDSKEEAVMFLIYLDLTEDKEIPYTFKVVLAEWIEESENGEWFTHWIDRNYPYECIVCHNVMKVENDCGCIKKL